MTTSELLTLRIRQVSKRGIDIKKAADTLRKYRFQSKQHLESIITKQNLCYYENLAIETEVSAHKHTDDNCFGPYEVDRKNRVGAYMILKELDGAIFRHTPAAAFCLIPHITHSEPSIRAIGG